MDKGVRIALVIAFTGFVFFQGLSYFVSYDSDSSPNSATTSVINLTVQQKALKDMSVSQEYRNALSKGIIYAENMHMSKQAVYEQLCSPYGDKFSRDAAAWAVAHMSDIDWNKAALEKAKLYYMKMNMSKNDVYDQLVSDYGEQFTKEEADYALSNIH